MPQLKIDVDLDRAFSKEDFNKIMTGIKSFDMNQRWNILFEDGLLYLHRSWTGHCIFIGRFESRADGSTNLKKLTINGDIEQYNSTNINNDIDIVFSIIKSHLIDRVWD